VLDASYHPTPGDGSTICAIRNGDRFEYVYDRRSGECDIVCQVHDAR
jgi:hypothetical protein